MTPWHPFLDQINLHLEDKISAGDASRQERTARVILERLSGLPGLVLADEVGMGKTFVALAVAASVSFSDRKRRPVVVMVPPSLREKWPRDFGVFAENCLPAALRSRFQAASAENGVQFLKLLDNPLASRPSVIFLPHGAMSRSLTDSWVKLAIIHRALYRKRDQNLRSAVSRFAPKLVDLGRIAANHKDLIPDLLQTQPGQWLGVMERHEYVPVDRDDPVPEVVIKTLEEFDTTGIYEALHSVPRRASDRLDERLKHTRQLLRTALQELWSECLRNLEFRLPLLILDEAHHLKNSQTRLAGLFRTEESKADGEMLKDRGPLGGVFERMLFLTATPFQLGHEELCSILERFGGIAWNSRSAPAGGLAEYKESLSLLRVRLDSAQESAVALDASWGKLREEDLPANGGQEENGGAWWENLETGETSSRRLAQAWHAFERTEKKMRAAEELLAPWVLRHLKPRLLSGVWEGKPRRLRAGGRAILDNEGDESSPGLPINGESVLPFLLAARATVCSPESRPLFAEGLASSYEAFRHTRSGKQALDEDSDGDDVAELCDTGRWYLRELDRAIPLETPGSSERHPKIAATVDRVVEAWKHREKVLVFCHFVRTGQTLRRVISRRIREEILNDASRRLGCSTEEASSLLDRLGTRFFDNDSPARRATDRLTGELLAEFPGLGSRHGELIDAVRRFLRTPTFLVRYFPIQREALDEAAVEEAFETKDSSGITLRGMLKSFFDYLERKCSESERGPLLEAIETMKTGDHKSFSSDEHQDDDHTQLLPNVRLVNGRTRNETRQRLMLTFNSPFFPEVLVASSVMSEGVDLHRFCRYIIHHDLDWNPSSLEQRTGRVDRIGAKVESCGEPIRIYLPFIAGTQDEKMYRVVMDRERWFSVVMGEQFKVDARSTEELSNRVPFPAVLASRLAFRLEA